MEHIDTLVTTKYSVIIPVYNSQKTIASCMYSVLLSMRKDVEILLVDNASTDRSSQIIYEVMKSREWASKITYLYEKNSGVSSARNAGINHSAGEYLIFLDSDDELSPDFFEVLDSSEDTDMIIYQMDMDTIKIPFPKMKKGESFENQLVALLHAGFLHSASNKRFKKSLIDLLNLRFDETLSIGEDFLFSMKYCTHCKSVSFLDRYIYKVHSDNPNSLSRGYRPNLTEQLVRLYRMQSENLLNSTIPNSTKYHLLQEMDYYHSKAVCSCIAETFKMSFGLYCSRRSQFQKIGRSFDTPLTGAKGYCNQVHKVLNWLLAHHIIYPIYFITALKKARVYKFYRKSNTRIE